MKNTDNFIIGILFILLRLIRSCCLLICGLSLFYLDGMDWIKELWINLSNLIAEGRKYRQISYIWDTIFMVKDREVGPINERGFIGQRKEDMMKTRSKFGYAVVLVILLFSCKTQKTDNVHIGNYQPYFNQLNKEYISTPSAKDAHLDTVVQVLSNLRDETFNFKDTITVDQVFNYYDGDLAIDVKLINEKEAQFDTFMVIREFKICDSLVNLLFPVIADSLQSELIKKAGEDIKQPIKQGVPATPSAVVNGNKGGQPVKGAAKKNVKERHFLSRKDILADSTRDLFQADTVINGVFSSTGWKVGDSIRYYKGFNVYLQDSTVLFTTDTVYVAIHDSSTAVKQYPANQLSKENIEKKSTTDRYIFTDQVTFKHFYKDEEDVFLDMVKVQGGLFKMGSNLFDEDERPATNLNVSGFLLGKYEITNRVFCTLLNLLKCDSLGRVNHTRFIDLKSRYTKIYWDGKTGRFKSYKGYEKFPVMNITWAAANKVCMEMGGLLPSEVQWEYAARGGVYALKYYTDGNKSDFEYQQLYAGSDMMNDVGWFVDNSDGYCHEVGELAPNLLGLYDMCGNVWEWCYDNYEKERYSHINTGNDPICINSNGSRVNRGGSWSSDAMYCRITNRNFSDEFRCDPTLGFRLMRPYSK